MGAPGSKEKPGCEDPDVMTLYPDLGFSALAGKVFVVESSGCHQCVPCREADPFVRP